MRVRKFLESSSIEPQVGDYVYVNFQQGFVDEWRRYLNSQMGELLYINEYGTCQAIYNVSNAIYKSYFVDKRDRKLIIKKGKKKQIIMHFSAKNIEYFSSNKEEVEAYLMAKKYNL